MDLQFCVLFLDRNYYTKWKFIYIIHTATKILCKCVGTKKEASFQNHLHNKSNLGCYAMAGKTISLNLKSF